MKLAEFMALLPRGQFWVFGYGYGTSPDGGDSCDDGTEGRKRSAAFKLDDDTDEVHIWGKSANASMCLGDSGAPWTVKISAGKYAPFAVHSGHQLGRESANVVSSSQDGAWIQMTVAAKGFVKASTPRSTVGGYRVYTLVEPL